MIRLILLCTLCFILIVFIRELRRYFARESKNEELSDVIIEGELVDIDKKIASVKARNRSAKSEVDDINQNEEK
jgi:hypothetical protein